MFISFEHPFCLLFVNSISVYIVALLVEALNCGSTQMDFVETLCTKTVLISLSRRSVLS